MDIKLYDCPHCHTDGVLPMSDFGCPNCKMPLSPEDAQACDDVEVMSKEAAIQELKRKKTWNLVLTAISYPILFIGVVLLMLGLAMLSLRAVEGFIVIILGIPTTWLAVATRRKARKGSAIDGELVLKADSRPPVVYLRSFDRDQQQEKDAIEQARIGRKAAMKGVGLVGAVGGLVTYETPEEPLSRVLGHLGPFVAIGRPGEREPKLGAARVYTTDDTWQDKIAEWVSKAGLVYIDLSTSKGVWWELEFVLEQCPPDRIVLHLPRNEAIWQALQECAPSRIAEKLPSVQPRVLGDHLSFRSDGSLEPLKIPWHSIFSMDWEQIYICTFRPLFKRLGKRGPRLSRAYRRVSVVIGFIVILMGILLLLTLRE